MGNNLEGAVDRRSVNLLEFAEKMTAWPIAELIKEHLGVPVRDISKITTGLFNETFRVKLDQKFDLTQFHFKDLGIQGEVIIQVAPPPDAGFLFYEVNMMAQEPWIHDWVLRETTVPIPEIFAYDGSKEIIDREFLILEMLPGQPLSEGNPSPEIRSKVLRQTGAYLREVHGLIHPAGQYGYVGPHHPMDPQSSWPAAFHMMWNKLLDDLENCGMYSEKEASFLRDLQEAQSDAFHNIPPALLHMDVWDQNILCNERGDVTGLVDWDRGLCGDPEIEFAVLDYCEISAPVFWEGYNGENSQGDPRNADPLAGTRHFFYHLYELQKYIVINILRRKMLNRAQYYKGATFKLLGSYLEHLKK